MARPSWKLTVRVEAAVESFGFDDLDAAVVAMRERALAIRAEGPAGWGEFGAFVEYGPNEAAHWLASAVEAAYREPPRIRRDRIPINATVPAVSVDAVPDVLARFPGARTAKVKVAEPGQSLADDVERVNAVRAAVPTVRVDANGGWSVGEAVAAAVALTADGPLEYIEQPCRTVEELAEVRRRVDVPIAADESIRKADDPLRVVRAGAAKPDIRSAEAFKKALLDAKSIAYSDSGSGTYLSQVLFPKLGIEPPDRRKVHPMSLAGDLISNSAYYALIGSGEGAWWRGAGLGLAAGLGALVLPQPLGLGNPPHSSHMSTNALTVAWYVVAPCSRSISTALSTSRPCAGI